VFLVDLTSVLTTLFCVLKADVGGSPTTQAAKVDVGRVKVEVKTEAANDDDDELPLVCP